MAITFHPNGDVTGTGAGNFGQTGTVLQTINALKTDRQTITGNLGHGNQETITNLSCSITMTSASNKVLVIMSLMVGASADTTIGGIILRGSTIVAQSDADSNRTRNPYGLGQGASSKLWRMTPVHHTVLDTPGAGTHTYTVKIGGNGGVNVYINREGRNADNSTDTSIATSTLTVMEIKG